MKTLRRYRTSLGGFMTALVAIWQICTPMNLSAATYYWDINSGTAGAGGPVVSGNWNTTNANWSADPTGATVTTAQTFTAADAAVFSAGTDATGSSTVTINQGGGITLGGLTVQEGNVVIAANSTSDKLDFTGAALNNGVVNVAIGSRLTIGAEITGTAGLTKTGNGNLVLTNNSNSFTGNLLVNQGGVVITNQAQLGGAGLVSVNGFSSTNFTGGSLILQGGLAGMAFSKSLSLSGRGMVYGNSGGTGALVNIGANNTISSNIAFSNGTESRLINNYGNLTLSGVLNIPTGNAAAFAGNGNIIVSGLVTGGSVSTDRFVKTGTNLNTTLWLQNPANNYIADTRLDSGNIRVTTNAALGLSTSTTAIDFNNGTLEILTDTPDFSNRKVRVRDNTTSSILFVSRGLGGSGLNQTVAFNDLTMNLNTAITINGRDGYNTSFGGGVSNIGAGGNNNITFTNNSNGILTLNAPSVWNQTDSSGARTFTMQGNGDSVITGNIIASANTHTFTKAGAGTLTLNGTSSTFTGSASVSAGTLNISTIGALNATSTGRVVFGGGTLNYTGTGETWTSKVLLLNATNNILTNNGTGALVIPQNVGNNGTGVKNLVLGGANTGANDIQGIITNTTAGAGVTKFDSGTWQISSPGTTAATIGTANPSFSITAVGTTASQTITTTSTTGLVVGQPISGTGIPVGTVISQIISGTQFAISQSATSTGTTVALGTVTGTTAALTTTAVSGGTTTNPTLTVAAGATANLVIGQPVTHASLPAGQGWYISSLTGNVVTLANTTGATLVVGTIASGQSVTPSVSPNFAGALTIAGGTVVLNPLTNTAEVVNNSSNLVFTTDPIRGTPWAGGTLSYKGFSTGSSETMGILTPTAGAGNIMVTPGASGTTTLAFGSLGTRGAGATLNFAPGTGAGIQFMAAPAGLNGTLGGYAYITNPTTGSIDFVATPTANTNIAALAAGTALPTLTGSATTNYVVNAPTTTTGAVAANTIRIAGANLTLGGALTITSTSATSLGGILHDNTAGAALISGAFNITSSAANQELMIITGGSTPANALTISSILANGSGAVTVAGNGLLILSGQNTFTGALTINEGTLRASGTNTQTLGAPAAATVTTLRQLATLDVNAAGATVAPYTGAATMPILVSAPINGSGSITTTASGAQAIQLGTTTSTGSGVFAGVISDGSGTMTVIRNGASGTLALTGLNTYTGPTILSGGAILQANILANGGAPSSIGASSSAASNLVFNGGTLLYQGSNSTVYQTTHSPTVSIDRLFTLAGNGTIDSSPSFGNNVIGTRVNDNASLVFNNTSAPIAFSGSGTRTLTLQGDSTGDNEMRIQLINNTNAGEATTVTKGGTGLWILNPATANTYTGLTNIGRGALQAIDGVGIPTASAISFNDATGGVFQSAGTSPVTFSRTLGIGSGNVGWTSIGSGGFSAGTAPLTVSIAGNPTWGSTANFLGTGNLILSSTSAFADVTLSSNFGIAAGVAATPTLTTTAGSATVNFATGTTAGLTPGQVISGNVNIPAGAFIVSINSATQITISTGTGVTAATGIASNVAAGGFRQIQVDDNTNTGLDFASVTGVISGTGGLAKTGSGTLILGGANTYSGSSNANGGVLVVQSIGASGATATSLGTNVSGGPLNIGILGTSGAIMYVGTGETTTRAINLSGTTGNASIESSGSGPLILSTITNVGSGAKTLTLRGLNTDANMVSSNLVDNGGALSVTKSDGGLWILSGTNTFTGNLLINGGLLGVSSNSNLGANGTGTVDLSNGGIYAIGGALTVTRGFRFIGNNSQTFTGDNAITLNPGGAGTGTISMTTGGNWTIQNTIASPSGLTINAGLASAEATSQARSLVVQGTGNTTFSGVLQSTGASNGAVSLIVNTHPSAVTTLSGSSPNLLSNTGGELRSGILVLDKVGALGLAAATFALNGGELRSNNASYATTANALPMAFTLGGSPSITNGSNPITIAGVLTISAGDRLLQNDITAGSGLTLGAVNLSNDNTLRTFTLTGAGTTNITGSIGNGGTGAGIFRYFGSGALNLTGANTFTGATELRGGTTTVSGASGTLGTSSGITVNQAILTLDNGTNALSRLGGKPVVLNGATLNLLGNAAGITENASTLTVNSGGTVINSVNAGGNNVLNFTTLTINTGGFIDFTGGVGVANNKVIFSTAPTLTPGSTGILARATVGGADFATYGANGIAAFTGYVTPVDVNSAAATDTLKVTSSTTTANFTAAKTINALAITGASAPSVTNGAGTILTLTSGGILATGGAQTLNARIALGAEGAVHVGAGASLTIGGVLTGVSGLNKNLSGSLTFTVPQFYSGTTSLNGGTTTLSGGANTIFPGQTLVVNPGATLDLNGNNQYVQAFGGGNNPGTGGTITSSSAALFTNNGNVAWGGGITGAITMNKTGGNTLTAESPLTYTGETWITGGTLTLRDNATLLNTAAINLNWSTLNLDSNANLQIANNNRVSDTAPIYSRGGTITYQARFNTNGTESLGAVSLLEGATTINNNAANNANNNAQYLSADLTLASLTRSAGTTVNFTANQAFGITGNGNRTYITANPTTLANGMMGAWAIANSTDFAAYDSTLGVGAFGYGGFAPYDAAFGTGKVTQILSNATPVTTSLSAATTLSAALRLGGVSNTDITFTSNGNVLNLEYGGLLRSNQSAGSSIGTPTIRGVLTAGGASPVGTQELVIYSAATGTTSLNTTATTTVNSSVISTLTSTVGLAPGQVVTNANFPTGTYIVSIDSPTQITVSQNATATGAANQTIVANVSSVVVNSVIADNGASPIALVKSGTGILNLSANNTYTGGSTFNQGTVNLVGSGVVIPAGGITLSGATLTMNTNAGQIDASNAVVLNDSSTLNLVGNNTLASLTFNNTGGTGTPTVATGVGILTLTSAAPITVTSNNVATVPTLSGIVNLTPGAKTFSIGAPQINGSIISAINPALNISAAVNGNGTSINKTGDGLLQLSSTASTFTGGINVSGGGLIIGASSTPTSGGTGISGGPLGSGAVTFTADNLSLLVDNASRTVGNNITFFDGTPTFANTGTTAATLTLNGALDFGSATSITASISNPSLTVALLGAINNIGSMTSITRTGQGTLVFNATGYIGDFDAVALGNSLAVSLLHDGNAPNVGNGYAETINLAGDVIFDTNGTGTITVGRAGGALPFNQASNKIISAASINTVLTNGLNVINNSGYGLQVADAGALVGTPTFSVATATASNVTQGLYMGGALSGTGFTKVGDGTLVLSNAGNTFSGNIDIQRGVVSSAGNGQLGNAANIIRLNPTSGTTPTSTFRATGTYTLANVIQLTNTANTRVIEVTGGNTLTLSQAFDLNGGTGATASLAKGDNGTLLINAANGGWSGALNINAGAVLVNNSALVNPLGTGTINVSPNAAVIGATLQLAGGVTINNALSLQGTNNLLNGGINFQGQLDNVSGTNTYFGAIAHGFDATIGARAGSTLNLTGLMTSTGTHRIQFNSEGNINWSGGQTGALFQIDKYGAGIMNISAPITGAVSGSGGIQVHKGTLVLSGTATTNSSGAANFVQSGAILRLDNATNTNNRLTGRAVTLQGGTFDFLSNNTTELAGVLTSDQGANTINNGGSGTSSLTFASLTQNAGSSLNVTGTFGSATNFVKFTTAPALTPVTTGILNRVTVNGNELASYNTTNGIVAFTGYSVATNILSVAAAQTFKATSATANSLTGNQTINALTLSSGPVVTNSPNVGGLGGLNPTTLTLTSGTILATGTGLGNTSNLSVPIVAFAGNEAIIHVASGQTLNVTSGFSGTGGLSKNLNGTMNFNAQQFISGTTYVNAGTLNLSSTTTNTLLFNNALAVNYGGTVDLNGSSQFIAGLSSVVAGSSAGVAGGTVTNSSGTQSTFTVNGNTNFAGVISGNIYLNKTGTGALNLQAAQTYTGDTLISGGSMTLADNATLNSTQIDIRYGTLTLDNGKLYNINNRVNDGAVINLSGATLNYAGRPQMDTSETLGAVNLLQGNNSIFADDGGTGVASGVLTLASINHTDATSTLRFNNLGEFGLIGTRGRVLVTSAPTLTNNIIGAWAFVDREFASYDATYGIGGLNTAGFAGYSGSGLNTNPLATDNVRFATTGTTVLNGNTTVNTLNFAAQNATTVLNLGGNTLTLQGGGLLFGQSTDNVDFSVNNGTLTSGVLNNPSDLFLIQANYGGTNRTVSIGAVIANNGTGAVRLIKASGQNDGVLTLNAINTYTGGTVVNAGTLTVGATGALGSGGITVNQGTLTQTAGGSIGTQALTMNGSSTVTLANQANTITSLNINNNGGSAPTLSPTGTLTLAGGTTVTTSNAGNPALISTGTLDLNGAGSYSINVGATIVNGVDVAPWQAGLIINSTIQNGGIVKSGNGLLQLAGANTFTGGVTINAGGLIIGADTNSVALNDPVVTGPLGTGTLTMAANTTMLAAGAARTITNNVTFLGDTVFNGTNNLTLNGTTTLPTVWNATVTAPQMTVTIGDASPSLGTDVINKSGLGTLVVGNYAGTINATGGLLFTADGNTLGTVESINLGGNVVLTGDTAVTVNRSGAAPNARNKTLQKVNLTTANILSVSNQSGYGLEFTGTTTMTGVAHFAVGNATASNVVQGLTLSGVVTDGGSNFNMIKSGLGTLALTNAGNSFGGVGSNIDVLNGILSASSDGALGSVGNGVILEVDGTTGTGFRATGTFSTARTFQLNALNNAFEVTAGNTLTLSAPFTLSAVTNTLTKNDNGVLEIAAANGTWASTITVSGGAILASNSSAFGTSALTTSGAGSMAYQLAGNVNIANALNLTVANGASGINSTGVVFSTSGVNTYSGVITQGSGVGATYGAAAGATLNITGGIAASNSATFYAGAGGFVNLNSVYGGGGVGGPTFNKIGAGTLNVTVNQAAVTSAINVNQGTLNVSGSGVGLGITGTITVNANGILNISDSVGAASNHINNRPLTLQGGTFNYTGNAANSAEVSTGALTFAREGGIFTSTQTGAGTISLTFASLSLGTDASANFQGVTLGTANNKLLFTTAPTLVGGAVAATNGILARATVNGSTFATYNTNGTATNTNGIQAFTGYNATSTTNINSAAATDTVDVNVAMTTKNLTATKTLNALRLSSGTSQTVGGAAFNQLTLTSGGLLATGVATHNLTVAVLNNAAVQSIIHVDTGSTLNVSSTLVGTAGLVKDGAGSFIISSPASTTGIAGVNGNTLTGNVTIARGTLQLNGGTNTLNPGQFLIMGGPAATLDLKGTSQQIAGLFTDTTNPGSGGTITSSAGTGQLVINNDNTARTWAGSFTGAVNVVRSGQNTLTWVSANSHTGATLINGGTTILQSDATLSGTSAIAINYATLSADNNAGFNDLTNRINDTASITLRGGTLTVQGRAQTASSEALGAVSIDQGFNVINPFVGGTGINSVDVSLASLSRSVGSSATLIVQGTNLGTIGSNSRVTVGTLNGVATTPITYSPNGSGLTNNIVGGWAVNSANEFLTYIPGMGLAALNQVGAAQYDLNNTFAGGTGTDNVRLTATTNIGAGGFNVNAVSMTGSNIALTFTNAGDTLNLTSGGLIGPNNNQTIGATVDSGRLTAGGLTPGLNSDLYVFNRANTLTINSRIIDNVNGGGSSVRAVFTASGGAITLVNPNNSYTGGTVLNGGTLNLSNTAATAVIPVGGLTINGGTVTMNNFAGQIAAANVVTMNGVGTLNLFGNNTLEGLVLNNIGGGSGNVTVNSFTTATATGLGSTGVLTIGNAGIVATSSNVASAGIIVGRADFGATAKTIDVASINVNGVDVAPLNAAFVIQGIVGTTGGITKTGAGVLQFNAQSHYTGATTVNAGGIRIGVSNGGSRFSNLNLNGASTYINLAGTNTTFGSLSGSGMVINSGNANTLTVGFDNTSTTFSGQLTRFNDAVINGVGLQKVGTGVMSMTSAQSFTTGTTGTITVNGGMLKYIDSGEAFNGTALSGGGTFTVNNGGILALDNTGSANVNSRLGLDVVGTLNIQGGTLTLNGNSSVATTEQITTFNVTNGGGRIELSPDATRALTLTITTLNTANGNGSLVVGGIDGSAAGTAGKAALVITTPNLIGGQGTGANGSTTMAVRHDILGDASASGLGTGFLVKDTAAGGTYRALASNELAANFALPLTTDVDLATAGNQAAGTLNVGLVGTTSALTINSVANTLTISGTSNINSGLGAAFGNYGPGGNLLGLTLSNAAASLTLAGATGNINVGNFGSTTAGTTMYAHVIAGGTLNVNGYFGVGNTAGLAKADDGVMSLNNRAYYTGTTTINGGTLKLNSGFADTLAVVATTGAATLSTINLNGTGSVLDLMGKNQAIGALTSVNPLPGLGGTIQNTGAAAVLSLNAAGTFSGSITGAIALTRAGNSTTTLTSANTYTGVTIVRGGTLQLRDSGSISSIAGLTLNYGTLNWDNFGLNPLGNLNPTRIAANNAVTMQGGTITINGAGSTDTVATLNSVTVTGGQNGINTLPYVNEGSTVKLTIGNLVRNTANHSVVNFNGFSTNNSGGSNTLGGQGFSTNSNQFITQLNGAAFSSTNLVNNLIGGWAVADASTFATYSNTFGIVQMGLSYGGFTAPGFDGTDISAATTATQNINDSTASRTITGAHAANSWRFAANTAYTDTIAANTAVTLGVGLITNNNTTVTITGTDSTSTITGAGSDLYFYINQSTTSINTKITGNIALVKGGGATLSLGSSTAAAGANNDYTGGTFVQAGTLTLNGAAGSIIIPGDLTINNAAVTMSTTAGQIATTSNVFINGGGSVTLANYTTGPTQTLASVTFTNDGGAANPTLSLGTPTVAVSTLILSSATPITSTNDSLATTPTISTGAAALTALQFSNANPVITVNDGLAETELTISAPITQNVNMLSLSKSGLGVLALSGANTFTTGFNLNQGGLMFGANSTGGPVTSGPIGTGTLTIANGTSVLSDGTIRTIGNATSINGDFTFGGRVAGNGVILSGAMNLGASGRVITVDSPANTSTISGAITSTATGTALTKAGAGTLVLSNAANNFNGAGVSVTGGILKNGVDNTISVTSAVAVSAGAGYDLNNFNQTVGGISGAGFITQSGNSAKTLTISSTVTSSSFSGVLTDNILAQSASRLNLAKTGAGTTLSFSGANTYSGTTTVNSGTLQLSSTGSLGNTAITVASTASFNAAAGSFAGTNTAGTLGATLTLSNGSNLSLADGTVGTFNLLQQATFGAGTAALTISSATLNFDLSSTGADLLAVGVGKAAITGTNIININTLGSSLAAGTYNLITANQGMGGIFQFASGVTTQSVIVGSNAYTLALSNSATTESLTVAALASLTWTGKTAGTGANDSNWNTTSTNWASGSAATNYVDGVAVIFQDGNAVAGGNVTNATVSIQAAGVTPGLVGFNNSAVNYIVTNASGSIGIAGTGGITKSGTGMVTLAGANTYSGQTAINGGILSVSSSNNLGNASITNTLAINGGTLQSTGTFDAGANRTLTIGLSGATLDVTASNTLTVSGVVSGSGSLTKTSAGTLVLSGTNTYSGQTAINGGILSVSTSSNLGDASITNTLAINGGTLQSTGTFDAGANRTLTVGASGATVDVTGANTLTVSGVVGGSGNLTKTNTGTLALSGTNTYSGQTSINGGTLSVSDTSNLGDGSATNGVNLNGGTLDATSTMDTGANRTVTLGSATTSTVNATGPTTKVTLSGLVTGSGNLNVTGSTATSTTVLTGSGNNYSGTTTVSSGTLQVGNAGVGKTGTGAFTAQGGSTTVTGTGTVQGSSITFATLSTLRPGDSPADGSHGTLTFAAATSGNYTFAAGSNVFLGISTATTNDNTFGGNAIGSAGYDAWVNSRTGVGSHDQLVFNGDATNTITFSGNLNVVGSGYAPQFGDVFNLLDWAAAVSFTGFVPGTNYRDGSGDNGSQFDLADISGTGLVWDISNFTASGVIVVVPEPSRVLLLMFGLMALFFRRRRHSSI